MKHLHPPTPTPTPTDTDPKPTQSQETTNQYPSDRMTFNCENINAPENSYSSFNEIAFYWCRVATHP